MPFEVISETLLKGGVAPRHVRRYIRELDEHLDDLTAQQRDAGYDGDDAASRARAQLGDDIELASAMLNQPGLRSRPGRLPWLVFILLPPVLAMAIGLALYAGFYYLGNDAATINAMMPLPQGWLIDVSVTAMATINLLAVPIMAAVLAVMADRQRLKLLWPLLGTAVLMLTTPMFGHRFGHHHQGSLSVNYGLVIPGRWSTVVRYWSLLLSHALTLLPAGWLVARGKRAI